MSGAHGNGFVEVGERCFVARYAAWDVNIGLVIGSGGAAVVDTRASAQQGRRILHDVRRVTGSTPVRWAVNTHVHFDHTFGNIAMEGVTIHAHENVSRRLAESARQVKALIEADPLPDREHPAITAEVLADVLATEIRLPDNVFSSVATIDLGDRLIELMHPGRGHTDSDLVVRVPDADVVFGGDLIEESAPPAFGPDSFPMEWAASLDLVVGLLTGRSTVVPGHGALVDKDFVQAQRADVADVSSLIRSLHSQGVEVDVALAAGGGSWPFPADHLETAVRRGYAQLDAAAPSHHSGAEPQTSHVHPPSGTTTLPLAND